MGKDTLSEQLKEFFKKDFVWHVKGDLLRIVWKRKDGRTYMPTTVARTLNLMESFKQLIAVAPHRTSNTVKYKWLPPEYREVYIPYSHRPENNKEKLWSEERPKRFKTIVVEGVAKQVEKTTDEI